MNNGRWPAQVLSGVFCGFTNSFSVGQVLEAARGELIPDQVFGGDYVNGNTVDVCFDSLRPGFVEGDAINVLQDIDTQRRLADLKDGGRVVAEIGRTDTAHGSTKSGQSPKDNFRIGTLGPNEEVEVFGSTRFGMDTDRIAADKKILNPVCVECE